MFERPDVGERAILVHIDFTSYEDSEDPGEFRELVTSLALSPLPRLMARVNSPAPAYSSVRVSWKKFVTPSVPTAPTSCSSITL